MFVTVELLKNLRACKKERDRFAELFPSGVELTRELIVQHAQEFNWLWCAEHLAGAGGWDAYWQAEKQAQAVYWQAIEPSWAAYQRAEKKAQAAYNQAIESAEAVYQQAKEQAKAAYNLACATAFADIMGL